MFDTVICEDAWDEVGPFREFMGYPLPWYSAFGVNHPVLGSDTGPIASFLRPDDRIFVTNEITGRGVEAMMPSLLLLDMTVFGRQETWEDSPAGWPRRPTGSFWRQTTGVQHRAMDPPRSDRCRHGRQLPTEAVRARRSSSADGTRRAERQDDGASRSSMVRSQ